MTRPQPFTKRLTSYVEQVPPLVKRMAENKRLVQAYLRGELSKEDLEKKASSLQAPYSWSFNGEFYSFQSKQGHEYKVALSPVGEIYFPMDGHIKPLAFEITFEPANIGSPHDGRVSTTIADMVKSFLCNGNIIIFICESSDSRQKGRYRLFGNWFKKYGDGFKKYDHEIFTDGCCYYLSLLLDGNNIIMAR